MKDTPPLPEDVGMLYHRAFAEYGAQALWNRRTLEESTPEDVIVVTREPRIRGDREARKLAEQTERACKRVVKFGHKPKLDSEQIEHAREMLDQGKDRQHVAQVFNVSRRAALYGASLAG
jgi:hypothetical protein